ncbi:hypothetical protein D1345_23025 [Chromobacterium rhizoryzae]|uniref:Uncharacterized protein n=1 Tax=Chromobacterium rhizoryzae TaxID=1778675 RepID=A0AAD0RUS5_9NEIS|nr:hypothetical protein D1345_23025 [Chromobacterium rhizoryzae]
MHNVPSSNCEKSSCVCCGSSNNQSYNPLLRLETGETDVEEYVHLFCAQRDSRFGFCWCCGRGAVYFVEDLNEASECANHEGESVPDYPDEDLDSYIEYVRKGD